MSRDTDAGVYLRVGPEIGVAATKSFVSQVVVFCLLSLLLGRMRHLSSLNGSQIVDALRALPDQISSVLKQSERIASLSESLRDCHSMLYFGRHLNFPVALEGALKMKEISYIHAEGYPSSELKHGVIALVDEMTPSVCIATHDSLYEKNLNSIHEIKARSGPVIAIANEGDQEISKVADDGISIPQTIGRLQPVLNIIPLQLLAYHTAAHLGCDIDKPRNLAKSVTVE